MILDFLSTKTLQHKKHRKILRKYFLSRLLRSADFKKLIKMYFSVSLASTHLDFSVFCSHPTLISHFFSDSYKNLADDEGWNIFQDTCEFYGILKKGQKRILIMILRKNTHFQYWFNCFNFCQLWKWDFLAMLNVLMELLKSRWRGEYLNIWKPLRLRFT